MVGEATSQNSSDEFVPAYVATLRARTTWSILCWRPKRTDRPELHPRVVAYVHPRSPMREFETRFCARVLGEATSKNLSDIRAGALRHDTRGISERFVLSSSAHRRTRIGHQSLCHHPPSRSHLGSRNELDWTVRRSVYLPQKYEAELSATRLGQWSGSSAIATLGSAAAGPQTPADQTPPISMYLISRNSSTP